MKQDAIIKKFELKGYKVQFNMSGTITVSKNQSVKTFDSLNAAKLYYFN